MLLLYLWKLTLDQILAVFVQEEFHPPLISLGPSLDHCSDAYMLTSHGKSFSIWHHQLQFLWYVLHYIPEWNLSYLCIILNDYCTSASTIFPYITGYRAYTKLTLHMHNKNAYNMSICLNAPNVNRSTTCKYLVVVMLMHAQIKAFLWLSVQDGLNTKMSCSALGPKHMQT